ncbi:hypothetical protein HDU67_007413 [Dinochytrium kinnereticum]|nr:hypothetical protein HDU67_007413 [Dinochytrium kinnereticum]
MSLMDLTFNLNLTEDQKDAKSNVLLPFGNKSGTIHFEAEYFDDDEIDPDDDLEL